MLTQHLILSKVIGHRGACGYVPENTLLSLRKAYELGAKWIEFDAMLSVDNEIIVMHDETLDHTTNSTGLVAQTTYAEIKRLDAGSWFAKEFAGEKVPSLREYLEAAEQLDLSINLEIKPTLDRDVITAEKIIAMLQEHWIKKSNKLLVSSFSLLSLRTARKLAPHINLGLLVHEWSFDWRAELTALNCVSLNVNQEILTPAIVAEAKQLNRYVLAYTVNDPERALELFSWGVDAVFTDYPDVIMASASV